MQKVKFEWEPLGLEKSFYKFYQDRNIKTNREFIPIEWTEFYFNNLFLTKPNLEPIQKILDNLDSSKKYFTVIEIEEGVVNNYSHLDFLTFSPGGKGDIEIPYPIKPITYLQTERNVFCSFMGSIINHPVREELFTLLKNKDGFQMWKQTTVSMYEYMLSSTVFSLCPRGRGPGSYRFYESLYMGAIPVYISDIFLTPFSDEIDWNKFCIMIKLEDINKIPEILSSKTPQEIEEYQKNGKEVYENFFKNDKIYQKIIDLANTR